VSGEWFVVASCLIGLAAAAAPQDAAPPKAADKPLDENFVLAAVNSEVVTHRDVLVQWRLDGRREANPARPLVPNVIDLKETAKSIVIDRLWIAHAKLHPMYAEVVTQREIDDESKSTSLFGALFEDPSVSDDERQCMRRAGEARIALSIALSNDPQFQRCSKPRPADIRKFYDAYPERRRIPTSAQLGRVLLSRESSKDLFGEEADTLVQKLRQRAIELGSLDEASKALAPGSYQPMRIDDVDHETSLRDDVLEFAKTAQPGELSTPIVGTSSVMLYTLLVRTDGREVSFEEAAPQIERQIRDFRQKVRLEQYFIDRILPEAYFKPDDLFDDEISRFYPGYKRARERAQAAAGAGVGGK